MGLRIIEIEKVSRVEMQRICKTCLTLATLLGDLTEETVIIGGLVPSLLIDQNRSSSGFEPHAGTKDIDLGLSLALFEEQRYEAIADRLREHGFSNDLNENGQPAHQRWRDPHDQVLVEFLIALSDEVPAGHVKHLGREFGAFVVPGLPYAFHDKVEIQLSGQNSMGAQVTRKVQVCGPASFLILKSLAFRNRAKNKDAYDIVYFIKYFHDLPQVASQLTEWAQEPLAKQALAFLREDFADIRATGPVAYSYHINQRLSPEDQADALAVVDSLLELL